MTMLAFVLAGWALCGDCTCEKLAEKCVSYYNSLQNAAAGQEFDWVAYYKNQSASPGPYGYGSIHTNPGFVTPSLQWAVPASCFNGPPTGPYTGPYGTYPPFPTKCHSIPGMNFLKEALHHAEPLPLHALSCLARSVG